MKFLDPLTLAKLSTLKIHVRQVVEGLLSGLHTSPYKGHSLEFAQHREYSFGDELRHIDWKVFGRSDKFFVKQFQDETNLRAYVILDASGSMGFSSGKNAPKLEYASRLCAALSYLLLNQEDAVSLSAFDTSMKFFIPPHHQLSHLTLLLDKLETLTPGGETDISGVLGDFGRFIRKRGLMIFVSDLLSDQEKVLSALKYFRYRHNEVIAIQVLDPQEISFGYSGENTFLNLEGGNSIFADTDSMGDEYRKLFGSFLAGYKLAFRRAGIQYNLVTTDMQLETALERCLVK